MCNFTTDEICCFLHSYNTPELGFERTLLARFVTVIGNAALVKSEVKYDVIDDADLSPEQVADIIMDLLDKLIIPHRNSPREQNSFLRAELMFSRKIRCYLVKNDENEKTIFFRRKNLEILINKGYNPFV